MSSKISFFGTTVKETIDAFKNYRNRRDISLSDVGRLPTKMLNVISNRKSGDLSNPPMVTMADYHATLKLNNELSEIRTKSIMRILVTFALLGISVYLLIANIADSKTLPCSIISAVTGYWLK